VLLGSGLNQPDDDKLERSWSSLSWMTISIETIEQFLYLGIHRERSVSGHWIMKLS